MNSPERLLEAAILQGDLNLLRTLLMHHPDLVHAPLASVHNGPPLLVAAQAGDTKAAALLLEHGADIDGTDDRGRGPLHAAAAYGHVDMINWLLDHGVTKNPGADCPPLHLAAEAGHDGAVRLLLYRGADIRQPDTEGRSAQDRAREHGHVALAECMDEFLRNDNSPD